MLSFHSDAYRMKTKGTAVVLCLFEEKVKLGDEEVKDEVEEVADVHEGPAQQQPRHPAHLSYHPFN